MHQENQIDLIDLLRKSYLFLKKYSKLIIISLIIGISIGFINFYIFLDFQTRLTITSEIISKHEIINTLSNLKLIVTNKQSSNQIINEIKDIRISDTSSNFINVDIILKKNINTEKITSLLNQYFNEQPYFKTKKQLFQNNAKTIINFIEKQLEEATKNNNSSINLNIDKNNILINNNIEQYLNILQKKQEYQNKLLFSNDVIYFININQNIKIKRLSYIINYTVLFFLLSIIIAIIMELNNYSKQNEKSE